MKIYKPAVMFPYIGWQSLPYCETKEIAEYALKRVCELLIPSDTTVTEIDIFSEEDIKNYIDNRITLRFGKWNQNDENCIKTHGGRVWRYTEEIDGEPKDIEEKMKSIIRD